VNDRTLRVATAVLALGGVVVTSYLLYVRQSGGQLVCATGGCETVQSSRYSELFGVPVAGFGLAAYVTLFLTALSRDELGRMMQTAVALAAVAFGTYLVYVQLHVIGAVCDWCLVSDALMSALAALALLRMRDNPQRGSASRRMPVGGPGGTMPAYEQQRPGTDPRRHRGPQGLPHRR
jgi:uncharacterized membrane protein